jgi:hypothetical protein
MSWSRATWLKGLAGALSGLLVAVVAVAVTRVGLDDTGGAQSAGPIPTLPSEPSAIPSGRTSTDSELGVFEPIRGWIVYPIGNRLDAVNPADPRERHTLRLSVGLNALLGGLTADGANRPMPAGWSADGTKLALSHEYSGDAFVMSADGSIAREKVGPGGCCWFVSEPWLSPDGRTGLGQIGSRGIQFVDLAGDYSDVRRLDPPLAADVSSWTAAWSPDGSRIAFVAVASASDGAPEGNPTLHVADFATGANRRLSGLDVGHIRHVVWSPDDSALLVVGGDPLPRIVSLNPLVHPQPTSLYLVPTDGSGAREIASGYYVAAAWSPDGKQIAAIEYGAGRTLVLMDADGTGKRVLRELPSGELFTGVAWHPLPDQ